jgi:hypothetical protein
MCDAEDVFEWLKSHDQDLTLNHLVEIWKQCMLEHAGELEPDPKEKVIIILSC